MEKILDLKEWLLDETFPANKRFAVKPELADLPPAPFANSPHFA